MKKASVLAMTLALCVSGGANAGFKEFTLDGHSATSYNERGYSVGVDMVKERGEKVFYASLVLPKDIRFSDDPQMKVKFDGKESQSFNEAISSGLSGFTEDSFSIEIARYSDSTNKIADGDLLNSLARHYKMEFEYIDSDGEKRDSVMNLKNTSKTLSELIKR